MVLRVLIVSLMCGLTIGIVAIIRFFMVVFKFTQFDGSYLCETCRSYQSRQL
ncbi:hypothetical protein DJ91_5523 [Priestia megaterium]|nr:hypothetical protein DJ91_5523 [Priestia megaterium]